MCKWIPRWLKIFLILIWCEVKSICIAPNIVSMPLNLGRNLGSWNHVLSLPADTQSYGHDSLNAGTRSRSAHGKRKERRFSHAVLPRRRRKTFNKRKSFDWSTSMTEYSSLLWCCHVTGFQGAIIIQLANYLGF